ncbi:hypothetical protein ACIPIN_13375 [Pseudomonas sp. NPDC087697]|uniref:hypothetical protein n=1 Tax=Pseudomonas sp. NPDC087697 TaxID=3364447 RepID=UPI003825CF11
MNHRDALNHLWYIFILAYGSFRKILIVQAVLFGVGTALVSAGHWHGLLYGILAFFCVMAGGLLFGFLPMALVFTPLYALISAKGYANWITGVLAGLAMAGALCLHPELRKTAPLWLLEGALVGAVTHWAYLKHLKTPKADEVGANIQQALSRP